MTDTNSGRLKMIATYVCLILDVPGESAKAVTCIQWTTDDASGLDDTSPDSSVFTPELLHEQVVVFIR